MPRPKSTLKKHPSVIRSNSPKRIILFNNNNNINDIINKFENSPKLRNNNALDAIKPKQKTSHKKSNDQNLNIYSGKLNSSKSVNQISKLTIETRNWWNQGGFKMVDSVNDDIIDNDGGHCDNGIDNDHDQLNNSIETENSYSNINVIDEPNVYDYVPLNAESGLNERPSKLMRLRNINIIRCQLNIFQRFVGILLSFPFLSSVNGAGLSTLTCAFFLPRFLCEHILYPIFRLILGTLYPAYASYKAVRNKDVKDYVSEFYFIFFGIFNFSFRFIRNCWSFSVFHVK